MRLNNIHHQGAGPTSSLVRRDAQESRNEAIHNVVAYASFGDVKSYVTWLASHYPERTEEGLHDAKDFFSRLAKRVAVRLSV